MQFLRSMWKILHLTKTFYTPVVPVPNIILILN